MNIYSMRDYSSHQFTIGDADFTFYSIENSITDRQNLGVTMHSHKFYELFHVLHGHITIFTEIGEIELTEKDTAIISPDVTHTTKIDSGSLRICVAFEMKKNKRVVNSNYYEAFQNILNDKIFRLNSFAGSHAFQRFAKYFQSDYPEKEELLTACLYEIMVLIKSAQHEENTSESLHLNAGNVRAYIIDEYFINKFCNGSLVELAQLLHISPQQTQRVVTKMYSQSFSERMTMMKMEYAKTLLSDTDLSTEKIAQKCGYNGTNGFFVAFKKYYGKTPNELRRELEQ